MVSTVTSGDVSAYVGPSDIATMYSVTDVAGINRISRTMLGNAAHAIAGMVATPLPEVGDERPVVGLTMFGVTTPAVTQVVELLGDAVEPLVFHATGTGGQSLEKLVGSGMVGSVIDLTTTKVADHLMGGVFSAGESRLDVLAEVAVPYVGSAGVTLMRTTAAENAQMGAWIARKLNAAVGPVRLFLTEGGVSMLDAPGQAFHDPAADAALFDALEQGFETTPTHTLVRVPHHVNDPEMAALVVAAHRELTEEETA